MYNYILTISLLILSLTHLKAQLFDEKNFTLYTTKDGLSNNHVTCILQDNFGYIWLGTEKGLNRFDGSSFRKFFSDSSQKSLPRDYIVKLKMLDDHQLAVSTQSGIHIINTGNLQARNLIIPPDSLKDEFQVNLVKDMTADKRGNIFILTPTGFYQFNKKNEIVFRFDAHSRSFLEKYVVQFGRNMVIIGDTILLIATVNGPATYHIATRALLPLDTRSHTFFQQIARPTQRFWFMHSDEHSFSVQIEGAKQLFIYDTDKKQQYLLHASFPTHERFDWRSIITKLGDSVFLINGLEKGVYTIRLDRSGNFFRISDSIELQNYFCSSMMVDKNGALWVGTNKGLLHENSPSGEIEKANVSSAWNPFKRDFKMRTIAFTNDKIFVGTYGEGILVYDRTTLKEIKKIDLSVYWPSANEVMAVEVLNADSIIVGTYGPVIALNTNNYRHSMITLPGYNYQKEGVLFIFKDSRSNIYLTATNFETIYFRNAKDKSFGTLDFKRKDLYAIRFTKLISEDPAGNIWFAGFGLCRYNPRLGGFDLLMDSFPRIKSVRRDAIGPVFDDNGVMYFGVAENGLIIYDPANKTFRQFTRADGLPDNDIVTIVHHGGKIWMGTESGIASFDIASKKISAFGIADDFPDDIFTCKRFLLDSAHRHLYAGFNNTLVRFNPDKLIKNNVPPVFFVEKVQSGTKMIYHPKDVVNVSYSNNNIVISLAAINYKDAHQQLFAYRFMDGNENSWQELGSQRSIILSGLSPGNHKLQVKAYVQNNSWSEQPAELVIYVKPPFWKTLWFNLLITVLVAASLFSLYALHIKRIRQKANIDKQLAELEMKGLHAQMNPHFIFNSLNSIKEMILEDEKQNASRYLSKFAQLIRTSLEQSRQTFITVKQVIDHMQHYLDMEKIRFEGFSYSINVEDELATSEIQMAPMLIQPLVENAIWHGLHNKKGYKKLDIRFYKSGEQLICEIEDNGIGIKQSKESKSILRPAHKSLGISNIHERLAVLNEKYKMNCSLTITDKTELQGQSESGTIAVLRLNIKT